MSTSASSPTDASQQPPKSMKNIHISSHPVISHKVTILRSSTTPPGTFRAVLREVTYHLGYEATQTTLTTTPIAVSVPRVDNSSSSKDDPDDKFWRIENGHKLKERVALIPILRSGQGMVGAMQELLPNAAVHHIGMYKKSSSASPVVQYYNRLPKICQAHVAYILDPVICTSATCRSVISILKKVSLFVCLLVSSLR